MCLSSYLAKVNKLMVKTYGYRYYHEKYTFDKKSWVLPKIPNHTPKSKMLGKRATADVKKRHIILFVHCYIENFEELRDFQSKNHAWQKGK